MNKYIKKIITYIVFFFIVFIAIIVFTPKIISIPSVKDSLLKIANKYIAGSIAVNEFQLSWKTGAKAEGIQFSNENVKLKVKDFELKASLTSLLSGKIPSKIINIRSMNLEIFYTSKNNEVAEPFNADVLKSYIPLLLKTNLNITDGRVNFYKKNIDTIFTDINASLNIKDINDDIKFKISCKQGKSKGLISTNGYIVPICEGKFDVNKISGKIDLKLNELNIKPVYNIFKMSDAVSALSGNLNVNLKSEFKGIKSIDFKGDSSLTDFELAGTIFKGDSPKLGNFESNFDVCFSSEKLEIKKLEINSPVLQGSIFSNLKIISGLKYPTGKSEFKGKIEIAKILNEFKNTLGIKKELIFSSGIMTLGARTITLLDKLEFSSDAVVKDIKAKDRNQNIILDKPIKLALKAFMKNNQVDVEKLSLNSIFATINAQGSLSEFKCNVFSDFEKMQKELEKFIDFENFKMSGILDGTLVFKETSSNLISGNINAAIKNLSINGLTPSTIKLDYLNLKVVSKEILTIDFKVKAIKDVLLNMDSEINQTKVELKNVNFDDNYNLKNIPEVEMQTRSSFENFSEFLNNCGIIQTNKKISGEFFANIITSGKKSENYNFMSEITDFSIKNENVLFNEPSINITSTGKYFNNKLDINSIKCKSNILKLDANGGISDLFSDNMTELKGAFNPDSGKLSQLLTSILDTQVSIKTKKTSDFNFKGRFNSKEENSLKNLNFNSKLEIEKMNFFGVESSDFIADILIKNGKGNLSLKTKTLNGSFEIKPFIDLNEKTPKLKIPDNSSILNDVDFTSEMASKLLALIHPVFNKCVISSGKIDLLLKRCEMDLDSNIRKNMITNGEVILKDIVMKPEGTLKDILRVAKRDPSESLTIPTQTIEFQCKDGRISSTPLTVNPGEYSIIFSGTIEPDNSLNYIADIPVNDKMVSEDAYKYLKNARIKILIKGNTENPVISSESFSKSLGELISKAMQNALIEKGSDLFADILGKL